MICACRLPRQKSTFRKVVICASEQGYGKLRSCKLFRCVQRLVSYEEEKSRVLNWKQDFKLD